MTTKLSLLVGIVLLIVLVSYMFVFQVRYDQVAVRTTFNKSVAPVRLTSEVKAAAMPSPAAAKQAGDAVFSVRINDQDPIELTVPSQALQDNAQAADVTQAARDDVAKALEQAGLASQLAVNVDKNRLVLSLQNAGAQDKLAIPEANDAARKALGIDRHVARAGSLYYEPGLKYRLPYPIHKIKHYSRTLHLLEDDPEEIRLKDNQTVVVRTYMIWRIDRPYQFSQELNNMKNAQDKLKTMMSSVKGVISSYSFNDLINNNPDQLKIKDIEQNCLEKLQKQLATIDPGYGVEIKRVGIRRVQLPEEVTKTVLERMRDTRQGLKDLILNQAKTEAATIRTEADSTKNILLSFAERRAQAIRSEGDTKAASYYSELAKNQELAIFLRQMEALKKIAGKNTTIIMDAHQNLALQPLVLEPGDAPIQANDTNDANGKNAASDESAAEQVTATP